MQQVKYYFPYQRKRSIVIENHAVSLLALSFNIQFSTQVIEALTNRRENQLQLKSIYLPELARPAEIELLIVGDSVSYSRSIDAARLRASSKFKSSRAFPESNETRRVEY